MPRTTAVLLGHATVVISSPLRKAHLREGQLAIYFLLR